MHSKCLNFLEAHSEKYILLFRLKNHEVAFIILLFAKTPNIEDLSVCCGSILNDPDIQRPPLQLAPPPPALPPSPPPRPPPPPFLLFYLPLSHGRFIHASSCPHLYHPQYRNNPCTIII